MIGRQNYITKRHARLRRRDDRKNARVQLWLLAGLMFAMPLVFLLAGLICANQIGCSMDGAPDWMYALRVSWWR